jgi:hypothetical protein
MSIKEKTASSEEYRKPRSVAILTQIKHDDTYKISSERLAKNRAQNGTSDDIYDTDHTLQMTSSSSLIDQEGISSNKPSEPSAMGVGCCIDNKNATINQHQQYPH